MLLAQYFNQIRQELCLFQQELPLISLEMKIFLNFMDGKRTLIKELLNIMKSNETDVLSEQMNFRGVITDDEYQELKKDLSKDTIARVLSNRKFKSLDSANSKYG